MNRRCASIKRTGILWSFIILCLVFLLSGCTTFVDFESSQEYSSQIIGTVNPNTTIGQVIFIRRPRVNGITLWLSQVDADSNHLPGRLTIQIYKKPNETTSIYTTAISTASIAQNTQININIPPLDIWGDTIYIELSTSDAEILVHGRLEDIYTSGQAYQSREPLNADIAFRISYSYNWSSLVSDAQNAIHNLELVPPLFATLIIPGYALVRIFHLNKKYSLLQQLAISIGLSLAFLPIIYLLGTNLGFGITPIRIRYILIVFGLIILTMWVLDQSYRPILNFIKHPSNPLHIFLRKDLSTQTIQFTFLAGILFLSLVVRLVMIRDLATPAWVDSFHHGLLTRLILQQGAFPQTYLPYLTIEPTLYHPGFHSSLAFFVELSGLSIPQAMLIYGQVLNAAVVLSVYLLTTSLTNRSSAGLFAALITGTFTAMPAYYTSWGRYPQLVGLTILSLPIAFLLPIHDFSNKRGKLGNICVSAIAMAGMFLVHYRVAAFLAALLLVIVLTELITQPLAWKKVLTNSVISIIIPALVGGLITLGWLIPAIRYTFLPRSAPINPEGSVKLFSDFSWHYLTPALGKQAIVLAGIGWLWSVLRKHKIALIIPGWIILLFFLANLGALNLPGGSFINNSSVAIMLFMPISVTGGYIIDQLYQSWKSIIPKRMQNLFILVTLLIVLSTSVYGACQLITILNPATILSHEADLAAIAWIDQNIRDEEVILINPFSWGYGLYAASDGGGWIPALAGNPTIPPPVLYGLGQRDQIGFTNLVSETVIRLGNSPDELWTYLSSLNIEYIYIGVRGGPIFANNLIANSHFEVLYNIGNTWVLHLQP